MNKLVLIPIIIGSALLVTGTVIFTVGAVNSSKNDAITNTYDINDAFNKFDIDLTTSDLSFEKAIDGKAKVVCVEREKQYHEVKVVNNVLSIQYQETTKWYEKLFSWDFGKRTVTVYLPETTYDVLDIKSSTGQINIPNGFTFSELAVKLSTGDVDIAADVTGKVGIKSSTGNIKLSKANPDQIEIEASTGNINVIDVNATNNASLKASTGYIKTDNFKAKNLNVKVSTGDVTLKNTVIAEHLEVNTSTGDVNFDASDANTIKVKTDTGRVRGTLLTDKIFYTSTDTGKVDVPKSTTGGLCEIETDTGDIKITIKNS